MSADYGIASVKCLGFALLNKKTIKTKTKTLVDGVILQAKF